jgi:hypothetical protein
MSLGDELVIFRMFIKFTKFILASTQQSALSTQSRNSVDRAIRSIVPDVRRRIGNSSAPRQKTAVRRSPRSPEALFS